jgi:hypothetical protein
MATRGLAAEPHEKFIAKLRANKKWKAKYWLKPKSIEF